MNRFNRRLSFAIVATIILLAFLTARDTRGGHPSPLPPLPFAHPYYNRPTLPAPRDNGYHPIRWKRWNHTMIRPAFSKPPLPVQPEAEEPERLPSPADVETDTPPQSEPAQDVAPQPPIGVGEEDLPPLPGQPAAEPGAAPQQPGEAPFLPEDVGGVAPPVAPSELAVPGQPEDVPPLFPDPRPSTPQDLPIDPSSIFEDTPQTTPPAGDSGRNPARAKAWVASSRWTNTSSPRLADRRTTAKAGRRHIAHSSKWQVNPLRTGIEREARIQTGVSQASWTYETTPSDRPDLLHNPLRE